MINNFLTKTIRKFLVGTEQDFIFKKADINDFEIPAIKKTNLYIHIPFCKSMCPYCPYNRVKYDKEMIDPYIEALLKEIEIYSQKPEKIEISSIYIGGGTPTNAIDELEIVINKVRKCFNIVGDIAIETTIADINEYNIQKLRSFGINMISIGVQSFDDKYLKLLGRNYISNDIEPAIKLLKSAKFKTINIDLIFAFPKQTKNEIMDDIQKVKDLAVDQITVYPLFTFPYSTVGEYLKVKKIQTPGFFTRRKFYKIIHNYFTKNGYTMTSVWSFKRSNSKNKKYSSVTREKYIGFGAGAGSRFENIFYFNTFSISEYENKLSKDILPIAINMPITKRLSIYYWFYWRLYDTNFFIKDFKKYRDWKMNLLLKLFLILGFCHKNKKVIRLTEKGSFWIHLVQNYFMLNYINKVWSVMKKEPFPERIKI